VYSRLRFRDLPYLFLVKKTFYFQLIYCQSLVTQLLWYIENIGFIIWTSLESDLIEQSKNRDTTQ